MHDKEATFDDFTKQDIQTDKYINDNTESDHKVTLSENDHQDLVEILKKYIS
jgi:hypothetical protein